MKKLVALLLAIVMVVGIFAGCNTEKPVETKPQETQGGTNKPAETQPASNAMTYAEYVAAANDTEVVVEAYVAAIESWWDGKIQVYALTEEGGYYIYNLACTEEEAAKFTVGTKVRFTGFKGEWAGEVEIMDAKFEILTADPTFFGADDVTDVFGTDELANHMNDLVAVNGLTVTGC